MELQQASLCIVTRKLEYSNMQAGVNVVAREQYHYDVHVKL